AGLAARQRTARVRVLVNDLGETRLRIETHHVARVVVREEHRAVLVGDDAVRVIAFPRPHDAPRLARGDDARDLLGVRQGRRRRRSRVLGRRAAAAEPERRRTVPALVEYGGQPRILPSLQALAASEGGGRTLCGGGRGRAAE